MLFNSLNYIVFLVTTFIFYMLLPRFRFHLMLLASVIFYCSWSPTYALIFFGVLTINYPISQKIWQNDPSRAKRWLALGVIFDLGILAGFKYINFCLRNLLTLCQWTKWVQTSSDWSLHIILPLAISFYTFQLIALLIDIYRRNAKPAENIWEHLLFFSFFPQLIAGPIVRYPQMMQQMRNWGEPTRNDLYRGLQLIAIGTIKKVILADNIAPFCNEIFTDPMRYNSLINLLAVYGFAVQIYCDFSGYCDFAIGSGRLFGIHLPENFNKPYWSVSLTEFWRRWHMSLSFWLRDYLYIPLGGSHCSKFKTYRNLMITMVLGGLWHGANWTFIFWGFYHGLVLSIERMLGWGVAREQIRSGWSRLWRMVLIFHVVCVGWIFFRADSIGTAWTMLWRIASMDLHIQFSRIMLEQLLSGGGIILALLLILLGTRNGFYRMFDRMHRYMIPVAYAVFILILIVLAPGGNKEFIYFQF